MIHSRADSAWISAEEKVSIAFPLGSMMLVLEAKNPCVREPRCLDSQSQSLPEVDQVTIATGIEQTSRKIVGNSGSPTYWATVGMCSMW